MAIPRRDPLRGMAEFVALDIGSSFIKAALLDLDRMELRHCARAPFPEFLAGLLADRREVDPAAVMKVVYELLERVVPLASTLQGVVLCGQMHGFVLVNSRGEAVSNYISWLDRRVQTREFDMMASLISKAESAEAGHELRPSIAVSMLYWLNRKGCLPPGECTPVSIADFVAGQLCGNRPVMEPTQAAAFGAFHLGTMNWHREMIGKLGLEGLRWPEVVPSCTVAGTWRGLPCYATLGDQQAALLGALLGAGELSVNIGTGSQVAVLSSTIAEESNEAQTRPYFDGSFLRTITHIPGGRALTALIGLLTELGSLSEVEAWPKIDAAVKATPHTDLRAGLAFFPGPCGVGGFLENLNESSLNIGHVFRAAFESMATNYVACAARLQSRDPIKQLVFSGGVARRAALVRELTAEALRLPHRLSPNAEDTLLGLMVLALVVSGRHPSFAPATGALRSSLELPS